MASYDLTPKLAEHLDRHLALCLVNFLFTTKVGSETQEAPFYATLVALFK